MPELPDILSYIHALRPRILGARLRQIRIASPFLLRTLDPQLSELEGREVCEIRRIGKRIAIGLEGGYWLVVHLMIAGRLQWRDADAALAGKASLAAFDFSNGTLVLTEAGHKRRASLHVVQGEAALAAIDPGGIDVLTAGLASFRRALSVENHTLKRALTDPRAVSGIGNAYSDEILHAAKLSPLMMTGKLSDDEWRRLFDATQATLRSWTERLMSEAGDAFPRNVTAFHAAMAAHGKFGLPCPVCGSKIQRIRYADNETNYCPTCQTGGKLLADRALSRLLGPNWAKALEE